MGLLGAAVGFGFIAGPALGAFLVSEEPTRAEYANVSFVSAALAGAAALAALALFRETLGSPASVVGAVQERPRRSSLLFSRPTLARFVAVMFLMIAAQALMETTFGLWADAELRWGPRQVGWTLAALGVAAVLLQGGGAGAAARILGERLTLLIGLALFAAGFGGLAVSHAPSTMAASLASLVVGIGLATPALNALIAAQAAETERGAVMGLSQSAGALGRVAGPLGAGVLFDTFGTGAPFLAAALLILGALFVTLGEPAKSAVGG
jgi:MFS family permease